MAFCYQAVDASGRTVRDTVQAATSEEAIRVLRGKGLLITRLVESSGETAPQERQTLRSATRRGTKVRWKEVLYFTQQMAMLLGSGARMVPALRALASQSASPAMKQVVQHLRQRVEDGVPLSVAMADRSDLFDGLFRSLTAAGEATGQMGEAFNELAAHARRRQEIRQQIIGAMVYPSLLVVMCASVLTTMFTFVLPRFRDLFKTLGADLPATTKILMDLSDWISLHWWAPLMGAILGPAGIVAFALSEAGRRWWAGAYTRIPVAGVLIRRIILSRIFRIWGVLVTNNVGLLDAIRLARETTGSTAFQKVMASVESAVTQGRPIGATLGESPLVPASFAAAVSTGEESGKLGPSLLFVANAIESENSQIMASLSRILEPVILIVMGTVVGFVAVSLFMPLFDVATLAGGN